MEQGKSSRRGFLKKAAFGGVGAALGAEVIHQIFDLWVVKAAEHGGAALNLHEMSTLAAIGSQIIPTDETPGAREAGVVDYIDTKIKGVESSRQAYHKGLQEIDNVSKQKFGGPFVKLQFDQQKDVLKSIEKSEFFERVLKDIIEAFSRSPLGQKVMGYPGGAQPHGYPNIASAPMDSH